MRISRRAQRELAQLPDDVYKAVRDAIRSLGHESRPHGVRKLTGRDGWRIRVGPYRVIYEIDDDLRQIVVLHIDHRRDVYRCPAGFSAGERKIIDLCQSPDFSIDKLVELYG